MLHFTQIQHKVNDVIDSFISHKKHENNTRRAWKAQNNTRIPITLIHTHHQHKSTAILNKITSQLSSLQRYRRHRSQVFRKKNLQIPYVYIFRTHTSTHVDIYRKMWEYIYLRARKGEWIGSGEVPARIWLTNRLPMPTSPLHCELAAIQYRFDIVRESRARNEMHRR